MDSNSLEGLVEQLHCSEASVLPPVELWNPDLTGDIDIVINKDGQWFHEGDAFQRESLVKLFSSILKKEGDDYFLVSPVEKFKLSVEDLPFIIVGIESLSSDSKNVLSCTTNVGDKVIVDIDHPIEVEYEDDRETPKPKIRVRRNLYARIHRNVYYELISLGKERHSKASGKKEVYITSGDVEFILGEY